VVRRPLSHHADPRTAKKVVGKVGSFVYAHIDRLEVQPPADPAV